METRFELLPLTKYYTAPAHPHATDAAMYSALFIDFLLKSEIAIGLILEDRVNAILYYRHSIAAVEACFQFVKITKYAYYLELTERHPHL